MGNHEGRHIILIAMLQMAVQNSPVPLLVTQGDSKTLQKT